MIRGGHQEHGAKFGERLEKAEHGMQYCRWSLIPGLAVSMGLLGAPGHGSAQSAAQPKATTGQPAQPPRQAAKPAPAEAPKTSTEGKTSAEGQGASQAKPGTWPRLVNEAKQAPSWSEAEIAATKQRCAALLKGLEIVAVQADPIREGGCGAPAPMRVISVGQNPEVSFNPPAVMTCEMVAAAHTWMKDHVQPAARELLNAPVIRIDVMSDYSCRNAYGRTKSKLSEHGRANALDIKSFATARGSIVDLLADWGLTGRDIAAAHKANEAKKAAEAQAAAAKAAQSKSSAEKGQPAAQVEPPAASTRGQVPGLIVTFPQVGPQAAPKPALGINGPSRLGGPKEGKGGTREIAGAVPIERRAQFLRRVHASACRVFGTVLGPEANEAHRNHFHVDMAERRSGSYCE